MRGLVAAEECKTGSHHVKTLMKRMGIQELLQNQPAWTLGEGKGLSSVFDCFWIGNRHR
jgi:hypothetical protein